MTSFSSPKDCILEPDDLMLKKIMNGIHAGGLGRVRFFMPSGGYKNSCPREATKIHALEQALGHEFLVASLGHEFLVAALGHEKPYTPSTPGMKETNKKDNFQV